MKIKALFTDVDGTLTDGRLYYGDDGEALKVFNVHDGKGMRLWVESGRLLGVISAKDGAPLRTRLKELAVEHFALKVEDKIGWMEKWLQEQGLQWEQLAYIGDDLNDLPLLQKAGFSACPADAVPAIREVVDFVCSKAGGQGAVRELVEKLL